MEDMRNAYMAGFSSEDDYPSYRQLRILAQDAIKEQAEGKPSMEKLVGYYRKRNQLLIVDETLSLFCSTLRQICSRPQDRTPLPWR